MSILEEDVIDSMMVSSDNELILIMEDPTPWDNEDMKTHLLYLQRKVNAYLTFIQSEEYQEVFPDYDIEKYIIEIVLSHSPPKEALEFFAEVQRIVSQVNASLRIIMDQ